MKVKVNKTLVLKPEVIEYLKKVLHKFLAKAKHFEEVWVSVTINGVTYSIDIYDSSVLCDVNEGYIADVYQVVDGKDDTSCNYRLYTQYPVDYRMVVVTRKLGFPPVENILTVSGDTSLSDIHKMLEIEEGFKAGTINVYMKSITPMESKYASNIKESTNCNCARSF